MRLVHPKPPKVPTAPASFMVGDWVTHEGDGNGRRVFLGCQRIAAIGDDMLTVNVRESITEKPLGEMAVPAGECRLFHGFPGTRRDNPSMRYLLTEEVRCVGNVTYTARLYPGDDAYLAAQAAYFDALRARDEARHPVPDLCSDDTEFADSLFRVRISYDPDWGRWRFSVDHTELGDLYLIGDEMPEAAKLPAGSLDRAWFLMDESRIRERHKAREAALSFLKRFGAGEATERMWSIAAQAMVAAVHVGRGRYVAADAR